MIEDRGKEAARKPRIYHRGIWIVACLVALAGFVADWCYPELSAFQHPGSLMIVWGIVSFLVVRSRIDRLAAFDFISLSEEEHRDRNAMVACHEGGIVMVGTLIWGFGDLPVPLVRIS